ncbi:MAG TPA: FtsQ-type POTRA domain-containing protein [Gemmatimonadaceae bacterium]|nr:FtsQ-type POTRA domain-containing protein [Gemmatimonadaceae bacterium]
MTRVLEWARRIGWRAPAIVAVAALVASAPWWGTRLLSHLSYFQLHRIEIYGRHYIQPADVLARLRVDTNTSIWTDLGVLERRVASHPQVRSVEIERKLPGTLVVRLVENAPVAFVPDARGLRVVDAAGRALPIDPSRTSVDLPVVPRADTAVLRLLADVHARTPELYDRISTVRRAGKDELALALPDVTVRAMADVSARRLADIIPVEHDLARRHARVAELDLRFRDQVIARLQ